MTSGARRFYNLLWPVCLIGAFWLRFQFIRAANLYPDEFVTLLAMAMIKQTGLPVLPSGLFYDHGLLYSYVAALASSLGDPALWGRLTSLVFGLATLGLTYRTGARWFSAKVGLLAAIGLALAPAALAWSGRVRMYALLQFLVLLVVVLMLEGAVNGRRKPAWGAVAAYWGAILTQFSAIALLPPLALAEVIALARRKQRWYADPQFWARGAIIGVAALAGFLVKRAGQPKGIAPMQAANPVTGIWQVFQIYSGLSLNVAESWAAIAPFFTQSPVWIFSLFALVAMIRAAATIRRSSPTPDNAPTEAAFFLSVVLIITTVEMLFFVSADRRDDKYLFMLLPVLLLLGAAGIVQAVEWFTRLAQVEKWAAPTLLLAMIGLCAVPPVNAQLVRPGEDYRSAFAYVAEHRLPGDTVMTGTPMAAYYYLGRNDFYAVQSTAKNAYEYRLLPGPNGQPVERWLGSPVIDSVAALTDTFAKNSVWVVLERWGLLVEYYTPFFMQNMLAQTDFVREDGGIIVLKSKPNPRPLRENPAVSIQETTLDGVTGDEGRLALLGCTLEGNRLTLYWRAQTPVAFDYTIFVNARDEAGQTVTQTDHRPLDPVYPTTLWPAGEIIRETSALDLPPGRYRLGAGMYRYETGERLWVPADTSLQNMVDLGWVVVP